jgi:hypothetical protein
MDLPKKERTFSFSYVGQDSGMTYEGTFTIKCRLNVAEKYQLELEKSRLISDMANPTNGLMGMAIALSTLRTKISDGPNWWSQGKGLSIEDEDTLVALFDKVEEESLQWRKELDEKAKAAQKELGK